MPTVLRVGPYRFFFYSGDGAEPPHVHVEAGDNEAKFWLIPVHIARNNGFSARETRKIARIIERHQQEIVEAWHEHFGS